MSNCLTPHPAPGAQRASFKRRRPTSRRFHPTPAYRLFLLHLIQARRDAGVTPEELAPRLELSPAQIAAFENGQKQLDFVQTREWCIALGVSFLDFMVGLDREITKQLPDAFTTSAPEPDDPYGVAHHVLPHVPPAPAADSKEGGAK